MSPTHSQRRAREDAILRRLLQAQAGGAGPPAEFAAFLTRCFVCRVRCLLDSTSGFLNPAEVRMLGQPHCACAEHPRPCDDREGTCFGNRRCGDRGGTCRLGAARMFSIGFCEHSVEADEGRSNGENGILVARAHTDADHWARAPVRAPCLCLGGGDLVLDPEGGAGDRDEDAPGGVLAGSSGARGPREVHTYHCRFEAAGKMRSLNWTAERHSQGSVKLEPEPAGSAPFCARGEPAGGLCAPYPGVQATFHASALPAFRNAPSTQPLDRAPSVHCGRTSRPWRHCDQALVAPPTSCRLPQGSLGNGVPPPAARPFPVGGCPAEAAKSRRAPVPPGAVCNLMLSPDVSIKVEKDSASEDTLDGYTVSPSHGWLEASDLAKGRPADFPNNMHLKTEPDLLGHLPPCADSRRLAYAQPLGPSVLGPHPNGRAAARPGAFCPATCQDPGARHHPSPLRLDCRVPGAAPVVKREPLDSPPWAAHSQGGLPEMLPKGALAPMAPPKAPGCTFLP
ncbi:aryl hydrocarbon receptor repressor-like [Orycteropus afer afer]|uniref:Aryl hydrocarbon receptor repressor-like n=1 Tax=Orycteropus afer afer TaxID=1230840 RepID=A0A8B7B2N3_ORYAF|nr:aryl hydrocarbon receptor repressor-like [Orycteropus afer afer]